MKTRTLIELLALSSSLYHFAKEAELMDRIEKLTQEGKDEINKVASGAQVDEDGNELEFIDKIILKTNQVKDELEEKIEEQIVKFYKKMNIAHLDEIKALNQKVEQSDRAIALLEARLNHLDAKK
jgi:polyhydroxyalkanoate synthesis regulator phasin